MSFSKVIWLNHRDIKHPNAGGAERTMYEISYRLLKKGYEVLWLSTSGAGLPAYQELNGIRIHRMGGNFSSHFKNIVFEKKQSEDSVVIDDMAHVVPWISERFTSLHGTVFFRHLHRRTLDGQLPPIKATILKKIESSYPRIYRKWPFVTESKQGIHDLEDMGVQPKRIKRIPPGVDFNRIAPKEKYIQPSLVYFGGMREYKRPYEAIYLVYNLKKDYPDIKLRMAGNGPMLKQLKSLSDRLQLNTTVEFLGRLDEEKLFDIVSRSWLNLHFSEAEGWGYSILEASACGTPTVAYNVPGVEEAIEDGWNGIKVANNERRILADAADNLIKGYVKWSKSSRKLAERYSWDNTTDLWEKHLSNLA